MNLTEVTAELRAIERDLLDLREQIDDAPDIGTAVPLRQIVRARVKRLEELELMRSLALRAAA